jgi:hypothetical protein
LKRRNVLRRLDVLPKKPDVLRRLDSLLKRLNVLRTPSVPKKRGDTLKKSRRGVRRRNANAERKRSDRPQKQQH